MTLWLMMKRTGQFTAMPAKSFISSKPPASAWRHAQGVSEKINPEQLQQENPKAAEARLLCGT
ncbi:MAG: hypothetical protein U1F83_11380 [Verrucomicrobiota bacterium]